MSSIIRRLSFGLKGSKASSASQTEKTYTEEDEEYKLNNLLIGAAFMIENERHLNILKGMNDKVILSGGVRPGTKAYYFPWRKCHYLVSAEGGEFYVMVLNIYEDIANGLLASSFNAIIQRADEREIEANSSGAGDYGEGTITIGVNGAFASKTNIAIKLQSGKEAKPVKPRLIPFVASSVSNLPFAVEVIAKLQKRQNKVIQWLINSDATTVTEQVEKEKEEVKEEDIPLISAVTNEDERWSLGANGAYQNTVVGLSCSKSTIKQLQLEIKLTWFDCSIIPSLSVEDRARMLLGTKFELAMDSLSEIERCLIELRNAEDQGENNSSFQINSFFQYATNLKALIAPTTASDSASASLAAVSSATISTESPKVVFLGPRRSGKSSLIASLQLTIRHHCLLLGKENIKLSQLVTVRYIPPNDKEGGTRADDTKIIKVMDTVLPNSFALVDLDGDVQDRIKQQYYGPMTVKVLLVEVARLKSCLGINDDQARKESIEAEISNYAKITDNELKTIDLIVLTKFDRLHDEGTKDTEEKIKANVRMTAKETQWNEATAIAKNIMGTLGYSIPVVAGIFFLFDSDNQVFPDPHKTAPNDNQLLCRIMNNSASILTHITKSQCKKVQRYVNTHVSPDGKKMESIETNDESTATSSGATVASTATGTASSSAATASASTSTGMDDDDDNDNGFEDAIGF